MQLVVALFVAQGLYLTQDIWPNQSTHYHIMRIFYCFWGISQTLIMISWTPEQLLNSKFMSIVRVSRRASLLGRISIVVCQSLALTVYREHDLDPIIFWGTMIPNLLQLVSVIIVLCAMLHLRRQIRAGHAEWTNVESTVQSGIDTGAVLGYLIDAVSTALLATIATIFDLAYPFTFGWGSTIFLVGSAIVVPYGMSIFFSKCCR